MAKKDVYLIIIGLLIVGVVTLAIASSIRTVRENRELRQKVDMLQGTLAHSTIEIKHDTIRDSIPVASQPVLIIDKTDYKKMEADKELIDDLNLKVSQIQSEMRTLIANQGKVTLQASADSDSVLRYKDHWCDFTYLVKPRQLNYAVRDSLDIFVAREYKHKILWGLIKWGTKGYTVKTVNFNPNSRVEYNRYIRIEK